MTTTITGTTKRQVLLPKSMCERKRIRPGTSLRITEVGEGFYVTPVPEPSEAELAAVFKALDEGQRLVGAGKALRCGGRHAQGVLSQVGVVAPRSWLGRASFN